MTFPLDCEIDFLPVAGWKILVTALQMKAIPNDYREKGAMHSGDRVWWVTEGSGTFSSGLFADTQTYSYTGTRDDGAQI